MLIAHPLISSLRKQRAGLILISLQIALTLAIVCNAIFIASDSFARVDRPSGVDERDLFVIKTSDSTDTDIESLKASTLTDLMTLRSLPDVVDAYGTNSWPLSGQDLSLYLRHNVETLAGPIASIYFADEHTLRTLGLRLISGRNFESSEIGYQDSRSEFRPQAIMISKQLAETSFPDGHALGQQLYLTGSTTPARVVGVFERLQTGSTERSDDAITWNSALISLRLVDATRYYLIRAKGGRTAQAIKEASAALLTNDRGIDIPDGIDSGPDAGILTFRKVRRLAYQNDRTLAILMGIISAVLLIITGASIAGLSSFWVNQRKKQIGIRRALGARKIDILIHFMRENSIISILGIIVGIFFTYYLNGWLMDRYELSRVTFAYILSSAIITIAISQAAALAPALRASRISPMRAIHDA